MGFEVPYINGLIDKFWYVVLTNRGRSPNFTDILNISESIIIADDEENKKSLVEIENIRKNTHPEIMMAAASFELWMSRNWNSSINKELDFKDGKSIKLSEIVRITDEVIRDITKIITPIAKKYTLQIAYSQSSSSQDVDIWNLGRK